MRFRSLFVFSLCIAFASIRAEAASSWAPSGAKMLGSSAACYKNGSKGELKLRLNLGGGRYSFKTYQFKDLKSINKKLKDIAKQIAKAGSPALKKTLKKQKKDLDLAALKLSACAMSQNKTIGCAVNVAPVQMKVMSGFERTVQLQVQSACAGNPVGEVAQVPVQGSLSVDGLAVKYLRSSGSPDGANGAIRVCFVNPSGLIMGCSLNVPVAVSTCSITATAGAQFATEHQASNFTLSGTSDCGDAMKSEIVRDASPGHISMTSNDVASYQVGFFAGADSFSYRVCGQDGSGCSAERDVVVNVYAGESFQGDEESLAPYRAHVSPDERMHLVRKLGNNRFDLIEGDAATMPLDTLVEQRFLSEDIFSPDLKVNLEEIRDRAVAYGQPIDSEEFIPDWKTDFPGADPLPEGDPNLFKPILPLGLEFETPQQIRYGMERWMMTTHRAWHTGNHRYHWGWSFSLAYYLAKARYMSPVHARLLNFWMGHFGTNTQVLNGGQENLVGYYVKTLERELFGSFRSMMLGTPEGADENGCPPFSAWQPSHGSILCDLVSNIWLSNVKNSGDNQNFARELMELYLMSPTDEVSGARNYEEPGDIIAATRFVSGIRERYKHLGINYPPVAQFDPPVQGEAPIPGPGYHDTRTASMFASLGAAHPGLEIVDQTMTPGEFVRHLLDKHPGVSRFIAGKLFSSIVYPDPSDALVEQLGSRLKDLNYDLKAFLKTILTSEAMFSARAAGRNCVSSPLEVFSKIFNTLQFPILDKGNLGEAELFTYHETAGIGLFQNAGEVPLGYPSVFTYDYCGRDPGKDGSTAWLKSYLLVFRVTALTQFLAQHEYRINYMADPSHQGPDILVPPQYRYDLASAINIIRAKPPFQDGSAESFLGYFEQAFNLNLNSTERAIFMEYLTHRRVSGGALFRITWNPNDAALMREKLAGMMAILSVFQQSATH